MTLANTRMLLCGMMLASALPLAGCGSPPPPVTHTTTTTTEQTGVAPAPMPMETTPLMAPGTPGTITTQTTHSQSVQ